YLGTSPITQDAQKSRIGLKNLARTGLEQLRAEDADKRVVAAIEEAIDDLIDDDDFWRFQANSLAVFATPDTTQTFRLPNRFEPMVEVSDRFYIKPLLRCITVPQTAFVLALPRARCGWSRCHRRCPRSRSRSMVCQRTWPARSGKHRS